MLPREHGAYGQMALPLVTSLTLTGASAPALLLATAVVAAFLAHEPLLVLLGRRGGRARRESGGRAGRWLAVEVLVLVVAGVGALRSMPPGTSWTLALPLLPASLLGMAIASDRGKSVPAEIAAAAAFSLTAVPVCQSAGVAAVAGAAIAAVFGSVFVTATFSVRGIVAMTRGGGNQASARRMRAAALLLSCGAVAGFTMTAMHALLPWTALVAAAPGLTIAAGLAIVPPPPARLRTVGWTLVGASAIAASILAVGLSRFR